VALSKAHNLLSARAWADTELSALVNQELVAYDRQRVIVSGPTIVLNPKASIAIAMVIHELSTNAVKYGSLSAAAGTVAIDWKMREDDQLDLGWTERGGPPVSAPSHSGFGSRMIERVVTGELCGEFSSTYEGGGFSCRLVVPSRAFAKVQDDAVEAPR
jgi:two-component sensor histidine kinase